MPVTGSFYSGRQSYPALHDVGQKQPLSDSVTPRAPSEPPAHFSMISTISHSSLAAAYQALRTASSAESQAEAAILSGAGVPAALAAYDDIAETD